MTAAHDRIAALRKECDETRQDRDEWLWCYSLVTGILQRHPGWETSKEAMAFRGGGVVMLEGAALAKQANIAIDDLRSQVDKLTELLKKGQQ